MCWHVPVVNVGRTCVSLYPHSPVGLLTSVQVVSLPQYESVFSAFEDHIGCTMLIFISFLFFMIFL